MLLSSRRRRTFVVAILGLLWAAAAGPAKAAEGEYLIGAEDVLDVAVWQAPELGGKVVVSASGTIALPLIGEVEAAGLTTSQLAARLTNAFSVYKRDVARVTVRVDAYNSHAIFLIGQVANPGKYPFEEIPDLWDAIREAGGPLPDAFLGDVRIVRTDPDGRHAIPVDIEGYLAGRVTDLPKLRPGDTVVIPRSSMPGFNSLSGESVTIDGGVVQPGTYPLGPARDLLAAILLAGGIGPDGDVSKVSLVRRTPGATVVRVVDIRDFQQRGDLNANPPVQPGDWITVPRLLSREYSPLGRVSEVARDVGAILATVALVAAFTN